MGWVVFGCRYLLRLNTWWCSFLGFSVTFFPGLLFSLCLDQDRRHHDPADVQWLTVYALKDKSHDTETTEKAADGTIRVSLLDKDRMSPLRDVAAREST